MRQTRRPAAEGNPPRRVAEVTGVTRSAESRRHLGLSWPDPSDGYPLQTRKNQMFLSTEEIPGGGLIPRHKHLGQDEILLMQTGSAHVRLGTQERDVHAGAIVFIPSDTWISVKNTGNESINLAFVFSDPGFDEFMRCTSVPAGD